MSMKPQTMKKENKKEPNLNKANCIKSALFKEKMTQRNIAKDLKITEQAVSRAIRDLSPNKRVDKWVKRNLGIAV